MEALLGSGIIVAIVWFWADNLKARERALQRCHRACQQTGVQLLDATIALQRLSLARNDWGQLTLRRRYGFEFNAVDDRRQGQLEMLGGRIEMIRMELPDGPLILDCEETKILPIRQD